MADRELDIKVTVRGDVDGAREVQKELKGIAATGHTVGAAAAESTGKIRGLNRALTMLAAQFGSLGRIVALAFRHPVLAAIAAVTIGIHKITAEAKEVGESLKRSSDTARDALTTYGASFREVVLKMVDANDSFKKSHDALLTKTSDAIKALEAEHAATMKLLGARKEVELAAAKDEQERSAIEERYRDAEERAGLRVENAKIAILEKEIAALEEKRREQEAIARVNLGAQTVTMAKAGLEAIPGTREKLEKKLKETQESLAVYDKAMSTVGGRLALIKELGSFEGVKRWHDSLLAEEAGAKSGLTKLGVEEARLRAGLAASEAVEVLGGEIASRKQSLRNERLIARASEQAHTLKQSGDAGALLYDAATGAATIRAGGRATPEQARAINEARTALGLESQNVAVLLQLLARLTEKQEYMENALRTLAGRAARKTEPF